MSGSMAGVLEVHALDAVVYLVTDEEYLCICGKRTSNHAAHQAEQLAAAGYGKLEDAWDRGMGDMAKLMKAGPGYEMGNPYRRRPE